MDTDLDVLDMFAPTVPATQPVAKTELEIDVDALLERSAIEREDIEFMGPDVPAVDPIVRSTADLIGTSVEVLADLDRPVVDVIADILTAPPTADELRTGIATFWREYQSHYKAFTEAEAELKAKQEIFNVENETLINRKKEEKAVSDGLEARLKEMLEAYTTLTGEKVFNEYLATKEFENIEYDEAAATTWARTEYPAALNEVLNRALVGSYLKELPIDKRPSWATFVKEPRGQVSKKF